jgi:DNA ligase (NAD+)
MQLPEDLQKDLEQLDKFDDAYYNGKPIVTDTAYDLFKDKVLRRLPPDHPRLDKVGHEPCSTWPKEKHVILMGSQNKVSTEDGIRAWVKKVCDELGVARPLFILQHKIDGFSLEVRYANSRLEKGVTRGNGLVGENITPNVKMFRQIPTVIPIDKTVVARGEGVLTKKDFSLIQEKSEDHYKNSRNAASGISRRQDGGFCKYIRFIAYDINATVKTELEKIAVLKKLGFATVQTRECKDIEEVLSVYRDVRDNQRLKFEYEIDGLVLKLNDIDLQEKMGFEHNRPEGQIALKFESDQAITTIIGIELQIGRTGKLTPVAILEPVDLMGSTIKKASLHNFDYIAQNGIGVGAEVSIEKKGDIIPQVVDILNAGEEYEKPKVCPSCGAGLYDDGVNIWCRNKVCRERDINRIVYWIQVLDMKGFSAKFVEKLWDVGKLRSVADIYRLKEDDFISVDGIGEKTIKGFFSTLKSTSEMYLEKFITALGIPSCSKSTADILVEKFKTWDKIAGIVPEDLQKLPGFAETSSKTICEGIAEVSDMAAELLNVIQIKKKKEGPLTGSSFCVTGSLASMGRKEFYELVVEKGGLAKNSVSEGLTYLVTNDKDSGSKKNQKARSLGVKIINEEEFFQLMGEPPAPKVEKEVQEKKPEVHIISENLFN